MRPEHHGRGGDAAGRQPAAEVADAVGGRREEREQGSHPGCLPDRALLEHVLVFADRGGSSGRLRHAAADPVAEHDLRAAVGARRRRRRARAGRPGLRGRRLRLRGRVRPRRHPRRPGRGDEHHLVGHRRHALVPGGGHRAGAAAQPRVRAPVPAPAGGGQGVGHPRPALGRPGDPRRRHRARGGRVRGARRAVRRPRAAARRGHRRGAGRARRRVRRRTTASAGSSTASASARARCSRRVPIWVGGSSKPAMRRAAERGDGWLPQGPPEGGMAAGIDFVRAHRAATRGDEPIVLGALSGPLYVGDPRWDTPRCVRGLGREDRRLPAHLRRARGRPDPGRLRQPVGRGAVRPDRRLRRRRRPARERARRLPD